MHNIPWRPSISALRPRDLILAAMLLFLVVDRALPSIGAFAQSDQPTTAAPGDLQGGFTYQGRLATDGIPASGMHEVILELWSAPTGGSMLSSFGPSDVLVTNGLFALEVDFGLPYSEGLPRWIEVRVRPDGSVDPFASLGRLPFTVAPHDHLYQDWIGSSANTGLTLRNTGSGDALYLESGGGNALEATGSGSGPVVAVSNQGAGAGISVVVNNGNCAGVPFYCAGVSSVSAGGPGVTGKSYFPGYSTASGQGFGVHGDGYGGVAGVGTAVGVLGIAKDTNCSYFIPCDGVYGRTSSKGSAGVHGESAVVGCSNASQSTICYGVVGDASDALAFGGVGVMGIGTDTGIWGRSVNGGTGYAGIFDGNVIVNGSLAYGSLIPPPSDATLKHAVAPITTGLDVILGLRPSTYAWNEPAPWDDEGREHNGFIAQEVRDVLPSAVYIRDEKGTLGLDYNEITAVLVKAVQEQQAQLDSMTTVSSASPANVSWLTVLVFTLASGLCVVVVSTFLRRRPQSTVNSRPTISAPV